LILPDWAWMALGRRLVSPFEPEQVNPHSYDLRLGRRLRLQRYRGVEYPDTPAELDEQGWIKFVHPGTGAEVLDQMPFQPGDSVLADTVERLDVPRWIRLQGMLKSSVAREGLNHRTALYVDAGFHGTLTLELEFSRSGRLIPSRRLLQVEAQTVAPWRSYRRTGSYLGQEGPTVNRSRGAIAFRAEVPRAKRWNDDD
jgi:dCTP deaminase